MLMPVKNTNNTADSITLNIRWFSVLSEKRGKRSEEVSLPAGTTGSKLLEMLGDETPAVKEFRNYIRLAVNHEYRDEEIVLNDGDEIALITPVSGG